MVWEAADKSFLTLLISDAKTEVEVVVDITEKLLNLSFADEHERLGEVVNIPHVVAVVEVSGVFCESSQTPLTGPTLEPKTCPDRTKQTQCPVSGSYRTTCRDTLKERLLECSAV